MPCEPDKERDSTLTVMPWAKYLEISGVGKYAEAQGLSLIDFLSLCFIAFL